MNNENVFDFPLSPTDSHAHVETIVEKLKTDVGRFLKLWKDMIGQTPGATHKGFADYLEHVQSTTDDCDVSAVKSVAAQIQAYIVATVLSKKLETNVEHFLKLWKDRIGQTEGANYSGFADYLEHVKSKKDDCDAFAVNDAAEHIKTYIIVTRLVKKLGTNLIDFLETWNNEVSNAKGPTYSSFADYLNEYPTLKQRNHYDGYGDNNDALHIQKYLSSIKAAEAKAKAAKAAEAEAERPKVTTPPAQNYARVRANFG